MKKTLRHPKASEEKRRVFQDKRAAYEAAGRILVHIDESGFARDMPRTHGYALQGRRCYGVRDWRARGRTNVIGAMIGHLLLTVGLFNSNIDADTFQGWTAQDLLPKLPPRCVIVMDNAAFHKRRDIQNLILKAGHTLEFLPPYSPDLNPIEHKWAQAKARRKHSQLSIEQLL